MTMVTTRSQNKTHEPNSGEKRSHSEATTTTQAQEPETKQKKTESHNSTEANGNEGDESVSNSKIRQLISQYGELPLSQTDLSDPDKPTPDTVLALLLNAILSSSRISHALAAKTVDLVIKVGYHKLDVLKKSSWEERTEVLTEGGYTHYR